MKLPNFKYVYIKDLIMKYVKGKSVLHLGCVGSFLSQGPSACLHVNIAKVSNELWGIDLDEQGLEKVKYWLPEDGNHIRYFQGSVEEIDDLNIGRKFQVIIVGAIIEHLSNPGMMLSELRDLLEPDGVVIITTPHCFGLLQYLRVAFCRREAVDAQHTCWFSVSVLTELCSRYGLVPQKWYTGYSYRRPSLKVSVQRIIGVPFFKIFPHLGGSLAGIFVGEEAAPVVEHSHKSPS